MKRLVCFWFLLYSGSYATLDKEWWKHTIIYELIPYSFKDSDGDGMGDFKGITSKLDHFVDLGIETIHLTPNFETTGRDMGYDITDYYKVDHRLGTMGDFDELIREMNKRKMKLILDLVINHSSHKHEWFQKSIDRINPYTDFYVWKNSSGVNNETQKRIPPNNWVSIFDKEEGSSWTWNEHREQFYFHQFLKEQPDFDLNNEILKKEFKKMIEFWLDRGVAGFRLDATPFYFEDKEFRDNDDAVVRQLNQPETLEFIHEFRGYLDKYNEEHGGFERIYIAEAHATFETVIQYYGRKDYPIAHFPYTFMLSYIRRPVMPVILKYYIDMWMTSIPKDGTSAWMTQDHDGWRVGTRIVPEYADIFTMLSMMLPGTVGVYYGQEIAMMNGFITKDQIKDYLGLGRRDPSRLAMQWDDTLNAGFPSNITAYLPPNSDYFERNVKNQKIQSISHYNLFKDLSNLRKSDVFKYGEFECYTPSDESFVVKRWYKDDVLAVVINLHTSSSQLNLHEIFLNHSGKMTVVAASLNSEYSKGFTGKDVFKNVFYMRPLSSIVLQTAELKDEDI